jgi:hypothetical protein
MSHHTVTNCRLANLAPLCCDNAKDNSHLRSPNPQLFSNIRLLWQILQLVLEDWSREAAPLQKEVDSAQSDNQQPFHVTKALASLQPLYLKCLFSYSMFFIALEGAYGLFYEELNSINKNAFFQVKHNKRPKSNAYIEKVRRIRNIAIAHIGSRKVKAVDAAAAMMWQPMTLERNCNTPWNLDAMAFGEMRLNVRDQRGNLVDQSDDFEVKGIPELDRNCRQYLDDYDHVCSDYLAAIHAKLPITVGDESYYQFK